MSKRDGSQGLQAWRQAGLDGPAAVGLLAASLALVPTGSRLSSRELVEQLSLATLTEALRQHRG